MNSTAICSRVVLHKINGQCRSAIRCDPRRNSIPPVQTLITKHLLAYLPRPPPDSPRYTPIPRKAGAKAIMAVAVMNSRRVSTVSSKSSECDSVPPPPPPLKATPVPQQSSNQGDPELGSIPCAQDNSPEPPKRHRSHRGRHLKRLSSKWYPGNFGTDRSPFIRRTGARGSPPPPVEKSKRQRCKLIGDDSQACSATGKQRQRYVTKDGKCRVNLGHIQDKSRFLSDIFTTLVDLKYRWFLFVFTMCYIMTWVAFAVIYFLDAWLRDDVAHVRDPEWRPCFENVDSFLAALLLSVESQRTIGYGSRMVTANCMEGVVLIMAQSIVGSIIDALMVGCMFVKISRPQKRAQTLIFSKHCVISERDEQLCLLFRIGDLRESHMVDAKIRAKLIKSRLTKEGEFIPLEQSEINLGYDTGGDRLFLVEPQTITHIINESSPFWDIGAESLKRVRFEIIVILEGIVEASGMTCQARTSYTEDEILWGHRFESCMSLEKGAFRVDYSTFDKTFEVQTSALSAKEKSEPKVPEVF
ncbi:G protein-activated inward rectifier potassium channel 4-like [Conger conger]|uniref:G protein-activated inward rectifier potassium channel 4-like n=1 Tax=Conger conger TaxID=82655 RepID=UPI002A5A9EC2|nr:G protein-activated inward rectifier potassium channel 4-like [Conger conger]